MQFAFQNATILKLLEKRAFYLRSANFKMVKQTEEEMTEEKNKNFEKLMRPNTYYCTFENETAVLKARELGMVTYEGTDFTIKMKEAKEPSNIMWQNRGISKN